MNGRRHAAKKAKRVDVDPPLREEGWEDAEELRWAVRDWSARIAVKVGQIHCRVMRTKWASVSKAGRLTFNTELLDLPKRLGEYVIVHELCHRLAPNHGRVFRSFLHAYLPDWEQRDQELRSYGD